MMKSENARNQAECEKRFPALTTPSQTASRHQIHFSLNVQTEQTERMCQGKAAVLGDTLLYGDGGEREGDGRYRAWCNHLHKHNKCGKKQEVNCDIMLCKLCKSKFEILSVRSSFLLYIVSNPVKVLFKLSSPESL